MSYLVLARKYRPSTFDEVVGQEHITGLLKNAIKQERVAHAYLFCGPRGIGKTSCARILAKCLNCEKGSTLKPCGTCASCNEIAAGTSFDVLEIDGASNRGIDEVRTLRENVKFAPTYGDYKIYIVDEVHMLTPEAFNALLKTLEEPPAHVKFIFATTDPNKVPQTIISRCQRYDFKRIGLKPTVTELGVIAKKEKVKVEEEALYAIAKASQGSFRDALSILDQVSAVSERGIKGEDVYSMLGIVELDHLFELTDALSAGDCAVALKVLNDVIEKGKDLKQMARDLIEHFRNLMVIKIGGKTLGKLIDYPIPVKERYLEQSKNYEVGQILRCVDLLIQSQEVSRITESLRMPLEIAFAKITYRQDDHSASAKARQTVSLKQPEKPKAVSRPAQKEAGVQNDDAANGLPVPEDDDAGEEQIGPLGDGAVPGVPDALPEVEVNIDYIRRTWGALTHAVSKKKMSLATYLQDGVPYAWEDGRLLIGFADEHAFHKDSLDSQENIRFIEDIFSEVLRSPVHIKYGMVDDGGGAFHQEDQPEVLKDVLETFRGKVVNKWHRE